jgi:hypothetical protein
MDLVKLLLGRELFESYRSTARTLASRLQVDCHVDRGPFERAQRSWKDQLKMGGFDPTDANTHVLLLGLLALRLFREKNCVSYSLAQMRATDDPAFMLHQTLVQDFATEYTLLEFIRGIHADVHFSKTVVRRLRERPALVMLNPAELEYVFRQVRDDPECLLGYPKLLHIDE